MRQSDYRHFMEALDRMFNPDTGIVVKWNANRIHLFDELSQSLQIERLFRGPQYNYLKDQAFYILHTLFQQNNHKINSLLAGIQECMHNLQNLQWGTYHTQELVKNAETYRKNIMSIIEEEKKQMEKMFSSLTQAMPGIMEKGPVYAGLPTLFERYFNLSDGVLHALTEIQNTLESKGLVQRWVMFDKPAIEVNDMIDGKKVHVEVHYSSDIQPEDVDRAYQQVELGIFRGAYPEDLKQKMKDLVEDLRREGQTAKKFVTRLAQIFLEILHENPRFVQAPEVTYHLLIRSQDRNWPSFAGACYVTSASTAEDVCVNIGQMAALNEYVSQKEDLKGLIAHELGHMLDEPTISMHGELNALAKQLVGKDGITEFDVFLFEFFNMCRTEGYAEVLANFHKEYNYNNPQEASFFFFDPDGYRKSHRVNYPREFMQFRAFLERVMNDKAPNLFQRYFGDQECIHLRYRFGYLLYLFTILGRLHEKNKDIVVLTENNIKKFRGIITKQDRNMLAGVAQSNKKLISFCKQYKIERIPLKDLHKYWLEGGATVYIFRPALSDFDEIMTDLHHLQSHSLYLKYMKACKALGIPRDKMIFSPDHMSRVIRVTTRVQRMKSLQYKG